MLPSFFFSTHVQTPLFDLFVKLFKKGWQHWELFTQHAHFFKIWWRSFAFVNCSLIIDLLNYTPRKPCCKQALSLKQSQVPPPPPPPPTFFFLVSDTSNSLPDLIIANLTEKCIGGLCINGFKANLCQGSILADIKKRNLSLAEHAPLNFREI